MKRCSRTGLWSTASATGALPGQADDAGEHRPAIEPRNSFSTRDADAVLGADANMDGRDIARSGPIPRGQRPWHVQTLLIREPGGLTRDRLCLHTAVRIGKARTRIPTNSAGDSERSRPRVPIEAGRAFRWCQPPHRAGSRVGVCIRSGIALAVKLLTFGGGFTKTFALEREPVSVVHRSIENGVGEFDWKLAGLRAAKSSSSMRTAVALACGATMEPAADRTQRSLSLWDPARNGRRLDLGKVPHILSADCRR